MPGFFRAQQPTKGTTMTKETAHYRRIGRSSWEHTTPATECSLAISLKASELRIRPPDSDSAAGGATIYGTSWLPIYGSISVMTPSQIPLRCRRGGGTSWWIRKKQRAGRIGVGGEHSKKPICLRWVSFSYQRNFMYADSHEHLPLHRIRLILAIAPPASGHRGGCEPVLCP